MRMRRRKPRLPLAHAPVELRKRLYTAADLAELPAELPSGPVLYELDNGWVVRLPLPDDAHGVTVASLAYALKAQGELHGLGKVRCGEVGVVLWRDPARVVGADAVFIRSDSLPVRRSPEGYLETIPDLVVEVVSKNDTRAHLQRKVHDYLAAGVRLLWVADPSTRTITVYQPGEEPATLNEADALTAGDVIPGFHLPVREAFAD